MLVHESVPLPLREYRALLYTWCLVKSTCVYLLPLLYFCVYLSLMFMYMIYEPAPLALDNSRLSVGHFLYTYLCSSKCLSAASLDLCRAIFDTEGMTLLYT